MHTNIPELKLIISERIYIRKARQFLQKARI